MPSAPSRSSPLRPLSQLYQKAALKSFRQKKYREALDYFTKGRDFGPQSAQALYVMGLAHSGLHEKDKAKVAFAEAIAADPTDARPYNALGDIQRLNRDYGKAIVTFQRAIEADPAYMESYGDLARLKFENQDTEGVVPLLQKAHSDRRHVRRRAPLVRYCAQPARPFPRGHCPAEQGRRARRWLLRDAFTDWARLTTAWAISAKPLSTLGEPRVAKPTTQPPKHC